jgi:hypothetical protein
MSTAEQTKEDRFATRARLEACARWLERQMHLARKKGDFLEAERLDKAVLDCRWRQR